MNSGIFEITDEGQFLRSCIEIFRYQYNYNPVYRQYVNLLGVNPEDVDSIEKIPFLPIRFFKTKTIISSADPAVEAQYVFTSSSTTGMTPSRHFVTDISIYEQSYSEGFRLFYGEPSEYAFLALLPSYLEREGSSLVYMAKGLISASQDPRSGFYLYNYEELFQVLGELRSQKRKTLLLGVTFALLDFASQYKIEPLEGWDFSVMETGGMKGRGTEIPRGELHGILTASFGVQSVHSEYGMCELLSQGYSRGGGIFKCPPWMRVMARDVSDPFSYVPYGKRGAANIIDLANVNSCSFIETEDVCTVYQDRTFSVEGRLTGAERRGCNMLIE